jgi:hypothetical protein
MASHVHAEMCNACIAATRPPPPPILGFGHNLRITTHIPSLPLPVSLPLANAACALLQVPDPARIGPFVYSNYATRDRNQFTVRAKKKVGKSRRYSAYQGVGLFTADAEAGKYADEFISMGMTESDVEKLFYIFQEIDTKRKNFILQVQ